MVALLVGWLAFVGQAPAGAQAAGDLETDFAGRITAERRALGRAALSADEDLVAVARAHSVAIANANRTYHNTALGDQVQAWQLVAENVGVGSSVEQVHQALMASPGHRANILDPRFTGIGIGVVQANGILWVTQVFRRGSGAAPPAQRPPPSTPVTAAPPLPASAPPQPASAPPPSTAPSPPPPAAPPRLQPAAVPTTTTVPPLAEATVQGARLDLGELASSAVPPRPTRPGLVNASLLAAALLWMVAAGMVRVTIRYR